MLPQDFDLTMLFIKNIAKRYDSDRTHGEHVVKLALILFDELRNLHGYHDDHRQLLEIAGLLHDIGWHGATNGKHHKQSGKMIRELDIPGLDEKKRAMCALIARYHTKSIPHEGRHRQFASLDADEQDVVEWLAGILRIADGLDCSHSKIVRTLNCRIKDKSIIIFLETGGECSMEIRKAIMKQDLLQKKTGRGIIYKC
ncbi:MAG: HD domain-containing protein [Deltaproteobacteria bacterium]|nr:HD domain-containing protein [Deltaproteobacteria bacterium]